ncbi:MerR family transcriptional regulator [Flavobacterium sp. 3HN19-14]|uniref:MerR family transcriptional regulator n=1 Tax=Flavobacterium sp. 3HN19-14 TaxID=3448133 RepID=UPI003EE0F2B3
MSRIKNVFSIKDLENLSGIKAHTIRIWEKRYNVLEPMRTDTNIRVYDTAALQRLLNITLLHNHGYKISKISKFEPEKFPDLVKGIVSEKSAHTHAVNAFKMAMMNFDQQLFFSTYNTLLADKSFREIFRNVFMPLLEDLGILWLTETITPAHEHFLSNLIKQKLLTNIEKLQIIKPVKTDRTFVLYLPMDEIHELGLLYLNYEIMLNGYRSVYLGESLPIDNLKQIKNYFDNITFVSYMTITPPTNELNDYLDEINTEILTDDTELWLFGKKTMFIDSRKLSPKTTVFSSIADLADKL